MECMISWFERPQGAPAENENARKLEELEAIARRDGLDHE